MTSPLQESDYERGYRHAHRIFHATRAADTELLKICRARMEEDADFLHDYHLGSSPKSDWRDCGVESCRLRQADMDRLDERLEPSDD